MSMTNHTPPPSRWRLLDAIQLIAEQIALASHCQELINEYTIKFQETPQEIELLTKRFEQMEILTSILQSRRELMAKIYQTHTGDHNQRCSLKHAIGIYQFATECLYANQADPFRQDLQQKSYQNMIGILGLFCWIPGLITCARCLEDELAALRAPSTPDIPPLLSTTLTDEQSTDWTS